jgi:hypothetical protein
VPLVGACIDVPPAQNCPPTGGSANQKAEGAPAPVAGPRSEATKRIQTCYVPFVRTPLYYLLYICLNYFVNCSFTNFYFFGKPAFFNSFFLMKQFKYTPKTTKSKNADY